MWKIAVLIQKVSLQATKQAAGRLFVIYSSYAGELIVVIPVGSPVRRKAGREALEFNLNTFGISAEVLFLANLLVGADTEAVCLARL